MESTLHITRILFSSELLFKCWFAVRFPTCEDVRFPNSARHWLPMKSHDISMSTSGTLKIVVVFANEVQCQLNMYTYKYCVEVHSCLYFPCWLSGGVSAFARLLLSLSGFPLWHQGFPCLAFPVFAVIEWLPSLASGFPLQLQPPFFFAYNTALDVGLRR